MPKLLNFRFPEGWYFFNFENTELKRSSKIFFSERHRWAVIGKKSATFRFLFFSAASLEMFLELNVTHKQWSESLMLFGTRKCVMDPKKVQRTWIPCPGREALSRQIASLPVRLSPERPFQETSSDSSWPCEGSESRRLSRATNCVSLERPPLHGNGAPFSSTLGERAFFRLKGDLASTNSLHCFVYPLDASRSLFFAARERFRLIGQSCFCSWLLRRIGYFLKTRQARCRATCYPKPIAFSGGIR